MRHLVVTSSLLVAACFLNRGMMTCDDGTIGISRPAYPTYGVSRGQSIITTQDDDDEPQQRPRGPRIDFLPPPGEDGLIRLR